MIPFESFFPWILIVDLIAHWRDPLPVDHPPFFLFKFSLLNLLIFIAALFYAFVPTSPPQQLPFPVPVLAPGAPTIHLGWKSKPDCFFLFFPAKFFFTHPFL